jgi:glycine/D-amino acid oxidase-like deaminating enzyme
MIVGDHAVDVAIVGGGYLGLSTALELARRGSRVMVLEAEQPGWGASGRNGGQVVPGLKFDPDEIVRLFGAARGERVLAFLDHAPNVVFSNIEAYGIECHPVRNGWIQPAHDSSSMALVEQRGIQWQRYGSSVEMLDRETIADMLGSNAYIGGWLDRRGGSIHPLSYLRGLVAKGQHYGAEIHGNSRVESINAKGRKWSIRTKHAKVTADQVLLSTNAYTKGIWRGLGRTIVTPNSFQIATKPMDEDVRKSVLPYGHVASDARRLLLYFRTDQTGRVLIGGRGSFREPEQMSNFSHLRRALRLIFPQLGNIELDYCWSGRVAITLDHMPHLHKLADGVIAAMGWNGRGVAITSALGVELANWFESNNDDDVALPFSHPKAVPFHMLQEQYIAAAAAWYRFRDWM